MEVRKIVTTYLDDASCYVTAKRGGAPTQVSDANPRGTCAFPAHDGNLHEGGK